MMTSLRKHRTSKRAVQDFLHCMLHVCMYIYVTTGAPGTDRDWVRLGTQSQNAPEWIDTQWIVYCPLKLADLAFLRVKPGTSGPSMLLHRIRHALHKSMALGMLLWEAAKHRGPQLGLRWGLVSQTQGQNQESVSMGSYKQHFCKTNLTLGSHWLPNLINFSSSLFEKNMSQNSLKGHSGLWCLN